MQQDLTVGRIGRSLILFSLPMMFGDLLQQFYNIADTLIVGRTIGAEALAAVGTVYTLMVLLTSLILGLSMGAGVTFAHLYGAKRLDALKTSVFNAFWFIFAVSILILISALMLIEPILNWLNIPDVSIDYAREYLQIVLWGLPFIFLYHFFASVLRSVGNTVVPLLFLGISALGNIVLDLVFILNFKMGVAGAAWATVLCQILVAICIAAYYFVREKDLRPQQRHMHYNKSLLRDVLSNSVLTAVQQSVMNFGILLVQGLVNSFGFAVSAAFAAVVKIDAFAYLPAQDFGNAFSTYVAQNHGAGKTDRIGKGFRTALRISVLFCLCISALVFCLAEPLMGLFVKSEEVDVIRIGAQYLRIEGACYAGIGILSLLYGIYRGLSRPGMSIVLTVISLGSRVALAYLLSGLPMLGTLGIWMSVPIGWALADLIGLWHYCKTKPARLIKPVG